MSVADSFCLICGQAVAANDRRILRNVASSYVRIMWQRLLDDKLKQKSFEVDVTSALGDEESPGCVHRKCFVSMKSFAERRDQFLDKLDAAIEKNAQGAIHCQKIMIAIQKLLHPGCRVEKELSHPQLRNNPLQNAQDYCFYLKKYLNIMQNIHE